MNKAIKISLIASVFALSTTLAQAAEVTGQVKTDVKVKTVQQKADGLLNKNEANIGSVKGNAKVSGKFESKVDVETVSQKTGGLLNENKVNIGSVSD